MGRNRTTIDIDSLRIDMLEEKNTLCKRIATKPCLQYEQVLFEIWIIRFLKKVFSKKTVILHSFLEISLQSVENEWIVEDVDCM